MIEDETPGRRVAASAVLTSISAASAMIAGGVLAVLVAVKFGNDARTDGFFAAYGLYSIGAAFSQSARTSAVPHLVEGRADFRGLQGMLGGAIVLFLAIGVAFVALGAPLAALLTGDLPTTAEKTAKTALLAFWPAVGCQLFAALAAASLGLEGRFGLAALAFGAGGILSIVAFLLLEPVLGIDSLGVAILLGSVLTASIVAVPLARAGWRPDARVFRDLKQALRRAWLVTVSALALLIPHVGVLVSIGVAARIAEGATTIFTYAYSAIGLLTALLASSVTIVLAAPIAETWDKRPQTLWPHHRNVVLSGLLLLVPVVAAAAFVGVDVAKAVLTKFAAADAREVVELFLLMTPAIVWAIAIGIPLVALYTLGRYSWPGAISLLGLAVQVVIALLAARANDLHLLAIAAAVGPLLSVVAFVVAVYGASAVTVLAGLLAGVVRIGAAGTLAYGVPAAILTGVAAPAPGLVALVVGTALFAGVVAAALPVERELGARLIGSLAASLRQLGVSCCALLA